MVLYTGANESIESVNAGMKFSSGDYCFMIGGSGDYAFKAAEQGARQDIYDCSQRQIDLIDNRWGALEKGDIEKFRGEGHHLRNQQFERINPQKVLKGLDKASLYSPVDIFDPEVDLGNLYSFNKVFLSNAVTYNMIDDLKSEEKFLEFAKNFKGGTLFYLSQALPGVRRLGGHGYSLEKELTNSARKLEFKWNPQVFKKAA